MPRAKEALMPDIYIPGVRQDWAGRYGWSLDGGPRKFVLHSTETDSAPGCVHQLAAYLDGWANPHLVWDPWTGDMAMTGRADWGEGALVAGNRDGEVVLQVEAVGRAGVEGRRPFFDSPMLGWAEILAWADSWGVPRLFPAGLPLPYPQSYGDNGNRSSVAWGMSGYFGHSQVPGNDHGDPGLVDLTRIFPGVNHQEDEVMGALPAITGADHTHPRSLALAKTLLKQINPGVDLSTDAKSVQAFEQFKAFFKVTGDPGGKIGVNTWRTLLHVATGGGR
jgi:hypothetical protein